jgi:choline dehydrogenase-like flavoprotein
MVYTISGRIRDSSNNPLEGILIKAYDMDPFYDDLLGSATTDSDGRFEIVFDTADYDPLGVEGEPEVFLIVTDSEKKFVSVKDRQGSYSRDTDNIGNVIWKGPVLDNLENIGKYDIEVMLSPREMPKTYEAVVIGSGFGGTIISLRLADRFEAENSKPDVVNKKRVCILERGQWWISHEIPEDEKEGTIDQKPTMRQFLDKNKMPYAMWAYPDNLRGVLRLLGNSRPINRKGVYDYRSMKNVHVIMASGVGGGSLVYSNVTEKPDDSVMENWPKPNQNLVQKYQIPDLGKCFEDAKKFIGTSKISTTAGIGKFKLARARVFQQAAKKISENDKNVIVREPESDYDKMNPFDADLSITDISFGAFNDSGRPDDADKAKYKDNETNTCQRQGRCVLGCIPGSRHTLNKFLVGAISKQKPLDIHPLCEVDTIEENKGGDDPSVDAAYYKYKIKIKDYRDDKNGMDRVVYTKTVILTAGSLGSTEILLRSSAKLKLSKKLGFQFTTNGDLLGVINPTKEVVNASRGPIVTSIVAFKGSNGKFAYTIEDSGIPKMFAELFATMFDTLASQKLGILSSGGMRAGIAHRILSRYGSTAGLIISNPTGLFSRLILNNDRVMSILQGMLDGQGLTYSDEIESTLERVKDLVADKKRPFAAPEERVHNILMLSGMGVDEAKAQLILNDQGKVTLKESYDLNQPVFKDILNGMQRFAELTGKNGKDSLIVPLWDFKDSNSRTQFVLHPLGGCPMADSASKGVVDGLGRVFRDQSGDQVYDDLYVMDGSVIPSPIGVNPSLTISALAFRTAAYIKNKE